MSTNWMIREDQLDTDQQDFVNNKVKNTGNIWIQGFAGSGKSVLLIHSILTVMTKEPNATMCIVVYTHSLIDMFKTGMKELKFSKKIPVMTYFEFNKKGESYDYIFCDEVQDLPADIVRKLKSNSKKVIVAGDSNQSIYEDRVQPDQIRSILTAEPFSLNVIHRLSRSIINIVQSMLPGMNIWNAKRDNTKLDVEVRYCTTNSKMKEIEYVWKMATDAVKVNDTAVILLPTHKKINSFIYLLNSHLKKPQWTTVYNRFRDPDYDNLNQHLTDNGVKLEYVGNSYGSFEHAVQNKNVILMTYHSAKGMDFENVFMPFVNSELGLSTEKDETVFMVALTRSRKNLYLTHTDTPHYLVDKIKANCRHIDIEKELSPGTNGGRFGF